jgi:hypothetical protein
MGQVTKAGGCSIFVQSLNVCQIVAFLQPSINANDQKTHWGLVHEILSITGPADKHFL